MKNSNKKGFTLVELLVVIAILAILATVAVVGYSSFTEKANISNDSVIAKELTTLVQATDINDPVESFEDVVNVLYDNGFYLANLNTKTAGCFFVWESKNNQILLVDADDNFNVLYPETYEPAGATWHLACSDKDLLEGLTLPEGVQVQRAVSSVASLQEFLAEGKDCTIYIDESLAIDTQGQIVVDGGEVTLKLSDSSVYGKVDDTCAWDNIPIQVKGGALNIEGGSISATGYYIDSDGRKVNTPIYGEEGSNVVIDGTTFDIESSGYLLFYGEATIKNSTFNSNGSTIYAGDKGNVVLENVTVVSTDRCVWATCWNGDDHGRDDGIATITIKSGTYVGGSSTYSAITAYSGDIVIEGGDFTSNEGINSLFYVMNTGSITIKGGTFNGTAFDALTVESVKALCKGTEKVVENEDGSFTITK